MSFILFFFCFVFKMKHRQTFKTSYFWVAGIEHGWGHFVYSSLGVSFLQYICICNWIVACHRNLKLTPWLNTMYGWMICLFQCWAVLISEELNEGKSQFSGRAGFQVWTRHPFHVKLNFKHKVIINHVKLVYVTFKFFNAHLSQWFLN
jgi:hypothetical protein